MTVDELALRILDARILEALSRVEVEVTLVETKVEALTADDLSNQYLSTQANKAFPAVNLECEALEVGLRAKWFGIRIRMRGRSLLLVILTLAALVLGTEPVIHFLRIIFLGAA